MIYCVILFREKVDAVIVCTLKKGSKNANIAGCNADYD